MIRHIGYVGQDRHRNKTMFLLRRNDTFRFELIVSFNVLPRALTVCTPTLEDSASKLVEGQLFRRTTTGPLTLIDLLKILSAFAPMRIIIIMVVVRGPPKVKVYSHANPCLELGALCF